MKTLKVLPLRTSFLFFIWSPKYFPSRILVEGGYGVFWFLLLDLGHGEAHTHTHTHRFTYTQTYIHAVWLDDYAVVDLFG